MATESGEGNWRRKWQPTEVFLPGELHGQRSLVGYGPWGNKESNMTEHTAQNQEIPGYLTKGQVDACPE